MYGEQLFSIGGFGPTLYGIMFALGVILCLVILNVVGKKVGLSKKSVEFFEMLGLIAVAGGVLSSMVFQWIYDLIQYGTSSFGSMTFIGGLIGGAVTFILGVVFFAKPDVKKEFPRLTQIAMSCILIAHAFGRLGCFFAGCCFGKHTDSWLGVVFPYGESTGRVIPTQLIESIFLFVLCGVTVVLSLKEKPYNIATYTISYGIFRFVIENYRDDDRGAFIPGLSPSQFWSILIFLLGAAILTLQLIERFKPGLMPKPLSKIAVIINNSAIITERIDTPVAPAEKAAPSTKAEKTDKTAGKNNSGEESHEETTPVKRKENKEFTDGFED